MAIDKIQGNLKLRIGDKVVELIGLTSADITNINAAISAINGLSVVATTGAAADVSVADAAGKFEGTNVEAVLAELADLVGDGTDSSKVHLVDESAGQTAYAKVYKLYQGADDSDMTKNTEIGTINIPLDKVVQSGKVVTIDSNADSDGDTTSGLADGQYIKLVLQNVTNPLYINVHDLVDVYTANSQGAEVVVAIDANNNITASIGEVSATKIVYAEADAQAGTSKETVKQALDRVGTALEDLGITEVKVVTTFTADDQMTDGTMEFAPNSGNINSVTYTGSNS